VRMRCLTRSILLSSLSTCKAKARQTLSHIVWHWTAPVHGFLMVPVRRLHACLCLQACWCPAQPGRGTGSRAGTRLGLPRGALALARLGAVVDALQPRALQAARAAVLGVRRLLHLPRAPLASRALAQSLPRSPGSEALGSSVLSKRNKVCSPAEDAGGVSAQARA